MCFSPRDEYPSSRDVCVMLECGYYRRAAGPGLRLWPDAESPARKARLIVTEASLQSTGSATCGTVFPDRRFSWHPEQSDQACF